MAVTWPNVRNAWHNCGEEKKKANTYTIVMSSVWCGKTQRERQYDELKTNTYGTAQDRKLLIKIGAAKGESGIGVARCSRVSAPNSALASTRKAFFFSSVLWISVDFGEQIVHV